MDDDQLLDLELSGSTRHLSSKEVIRINDEKLNFNEHLNWIKQGRIVLFVLASFAGVGILVSLWTHPYDASTLDILLEGGVLLLAYLLSAIFLPRNPLVCLAIGAAFYLLVIVFYALIDISTLAGGLIFKIILIIGLFRGLIGAVRLRKSTDRLRKMGVPHHEVALATRQLKDIPRTPQQSEGKQA